MCVCWSGRGRESETESNMRMDSLSPAKDGVKVSCFLLLFYFILSSTVPFLAYWFVPLFLSPVFPSFHPCLCACFFLVFVFLFIPPPPHMTYAGN